MVCLCAASDFVFATTLRACLDDVFSFAVLHTR